MLLSLQGSPAVLRVRQSPVTAIVDCRLSIVDCGDEI
jgi:hypothetical protein